MLFVKTYLISAVLFGLFYHYVTANGPHPMPWWPDTFRMGAFMGVMPVLLAIRFRLDKRANRQMMKAGRAFEEAVRKSGKMPPPAK